eukprot:jgi/Antlo1/1811/19
MRQSYTREHAEPCTSSECWCHVAKYLQTHHAVQYGIALRSLSMQSHEKHPVPKRFQIDPATR